MRNSPQPQARCLLTQRPCASCRLRSLRPSLWLITGTGCRCLCPACRLCPGTTPRVCPVHQAPGGCYPCHRPRATPCPCRQVASAHCLHRPPRPRFKASERRRSTPRPYLLTPCHLSMVRCDLPNDLSAGRHDQPRAAAMQRISAKQCTVQLLCSSLRAALRKGGSIPLACLTTVASASRTARAARFHHARGTAASTAGRAPHVAFRLRQ